MQIVEYFVWEVKEISLYIHKSANQGKFSSIQNLYGSLKRFQCLLLSFFLDNC